MMRKKRKVGLPPGTMFYTGNKQELPIRITYTEFNPEQHRHEVYGRNQNLPLYQPNEEWIQWYDIRGLHDLTLIQQITKTFGVHSLMAEDIVDVNQRPNYEEFDNGHFISLKSFTHDRASNKVITQSISIYFGRGFVLSFQEHEDDVFKLLRDRISDKKGRVRLRGADYLAYAIVDMVVDNYYNIIDSIELKLEELEVRISDKPEEVDKGEMLEHKVNIIKMRRAVVSLREAISKLTRSDSELIDPKNQLFIKDVYDHIVQISESLDIFRDILGGLQDLYISEISFKMNKVMQFLTIVTAIFVPLSFLTGLYGMNFKYIPELDFRYGYFILWGVMLLCSIVMLWWFRKQKWL